MKVNALKTVLLASAVLLATGAAPDWTVTVEETEAGHLIGNPAAATKVTEYISYTCSHCATFARSGDPELKISYVRTGKVSLEIRHFLRDPIDLTAAMLAHCGDPDKFALNHSAIMLSQDKWLAVAQRATQGQMQRWSNPDRAAARRAIASDLDFYELMEGRGYRITDVDRCLADSAKEAELVQATRTYATDLGLQGTPSFTINGDVLDGVHSWPNLQSALDAHLDTQNAEDS